MVSVFLLEGCLLINKTQAKRLKEIEKLKPIDVVIVPGCPLNKGEWDMLLRARVLWGDYLYKQGIASNVLFSGSAVYTPWMEGPSMALYADKLGISREHILVDSLAEHSTENLFYGYQLAKQKGYKTIAVATDPIQCKMLKRFARRNFNEKIYFIPIVFDSIKSKMETKVSIDTNLTKRANFVSLPNRESYKERLGGTRGRHIKKKA